MPPIYGSNNTNAATPANFVPEFWSGTLLAHFYENTILPHIVNTDYEGEIKNSGSTVRIRRPPKVSIGDYTPSGTAGYDPATHSIVYEELSAEELELHIDQAKNFAFKVDDVLEAQADVKVATEAMKDAAEGMKIHIERDVFNHIYTGVAAQNQLGSDANPEIVGADNVVDHILEMGLRLDEANIPESGRFVVVPPWMAMRLKNSVLRDASLSGDGKSMLRTSELGTIDRFSVFQSNLLPQVADGNGDPVDVILGGTKAFATFANQVTKTETLRLESQFGDGVRGLQVYGRKVVQPTAGVCLFAKRGAASPLA